MSKLAIDITEVMIEDDKTNGGDDAFVTNLPGNFIRRTQLKKTKILEIYVIAAKLRSYEITWLKDRLKNDYMHA